jgi:hypothetical protein
MGIARRKGGIETAAAALVIVAPIIQINTFFY